MIVKYDKAGQQNQNIWGKIRFTYGFIFLFSLFSLLYLAFFFDPESMIYYLIHFNNSIICMVSVVVGGFNKKNIRPLCDLPPFRHSI